MLFATSSFSTAAALSTYASLCVLIGADILLPAANAAKDDEYYRAGMGNPNVNIKMYWADAYNVLQDLDKFSSLYIQYHNCAWSQNKEYYDYNEESGSGDETDYWYMGATPNYAANVAYSLYGSLSGESFSGCNENTFINSFTTNAGFEPFAQALYNAGAADQDYSQSYSSECQGAAGIACDYQTGFAYVSFSTDSCDPYYANGVSDTLGYMNSAFQSAQCVKIYDGNYEQYQNNNNNYYYDGNGRDLSKEDTNSNESSENTNKGESVNSKETAAKKSLESKYDEDRNLQYNYGGYNYGYGYNGYNSYNNNYYNYYGTPLALLYYSNACFVQNFWAPNSGCPDPYGLLEVYQENFNKGVRKSMKVDTYVTYRANMEKGKQYVKSGGLCFVIAAILFMTEQVLAYRNKKRGRSVKALKITKKKGNSKQKTPCTEKAKSKKSSHKKKKSIVNLVESASMKMKDSVKEKLAKVSKSAKCTSGEEIIDDDKDGVMKSASVEIKEAAHTNNSSPQAYEAPSETEMKSVKTESNSMKAAVEKGEVTAAQTHALEATK